MREDMINGNLPLPELTKFVDFFGLEFTGKVKEMWSSLWHNYCANKGSTSYIYWLENVGPENLENFLQVVKALQKAGWIEMDTSNKYSSISLNESKLLEFVSMEELDLIRFSKRFHKYLPIANQVTEFGLAKVRLKDSNLKHTLIRDGMEIGAKSPFLFDSDMLNQHFDEVVKTINKGIEKTMAKSTEIRNDLANYGNVSKEILADIIDNPNRVYSLGSNHVDSRGRAIKTGLKKVFNPIGYKTARSSIVIPNRYRKVATTAGRDNLFLFVAELNGYKSGTVSGKLEFGQECWVKETLPHELHEMVWCKRIYKDLSGFMAAQIKGKDFYWSVPLELDQGASLLQYIGVLLGDKQLLEMTNVISDGTLLDPWGQVAGVNRKITKGPLMKMIYGSNQNVTKLLDDDKSEYTIEDVILLEEGLHQGGYGVANALKEFVISNANMGPVMYPVVWKDKLVVPCNRHHTHGERPVFYTSVDSKGLNKKVTHWKTVKTPDLVSFKRWTMTGLIHSLDSQAIDAVMKKLSWGIDIHDAIICNPEDANLVRISYAEVLKEIYNDRESILNNYFASVGIKGTAQARRDWDKVKSLITPIEGEFQPSMWAMK